MTQGPEARGSGERRSVARGSTPRGGRRIVAEICIVLGLSLGASAVYSAVSLVNSATRTQSISSQTTTLNTSLSERPFFDLLYQLLSIFFDLVPVALVAFLVWRTASPHLARIGLDFSRPGRDALTGAGLALLIGIPGLGLYFTGRALGLSLNVDPNSLDQYWWTVPVLILSALRSGVVEEVIVVGYLFDRLRMLGLSNAVIILLTALLRGSYHLYQGFPAFIGNTAMGLLFGWLFSRYGRVLPLIVAHLLMDSAVFIGYPWAAATFPDLFGL